MGFYRVEYVRKGLRRLRLSSRQYKLKEIDCSGLIELVNIVKHTQSLLSAKHAKADSRCERMFLDIQGHSIR